MDLDKNEIDDLTTAYVEGDADDRVTTIACISDVISRRPDLFDRAVSAIRELFEVDNFRQSAS